MTPFEVIQNDREGLQSDCDLECGFSKNPQCLKKFCVSFLLAGEDITIILLIISIGIWWLWSYIPFSTYLGDITPYLKGYFYFTLNTNHLKRLRTWVHFTIFFSILPCLETYPSCLASLPSNSKLLVLLSQHQSSLDSPGCESCAHLDSSWNLLASPATHPGIWIKWLPLVLPLPAVLVVAWPHSPLLNELTFVSISSVSKGERHQRGLLLQFSHSASHWGWSSSHACDCIVRSRGLFFPLGKYSWTYNNWIVDMHRPGPRILQWFAFLWSCQKDGILIPNILIAILDSALVQGWIFKALDIPTGLCIWMYYASCPTTYGYPTLRQTSMWYLWKARSGTHSEEE